MRQIPQRRGKTQGKRNEHQEAEVGKLAAIIMLTAISLWAITGTVVIIGLLL